MSLPSTSTDQNPSHTYILNDSFTVSLIVSGSNGSDTYTRENYIIIYSNPSSITDDENSALPQAYYLYNSYPNPFNPITNITYDLPVKSDVKIEVYNILGQRITILTDKRQDPGNYHITWNSNSQAGIYIASGVYILQFRAAGIKDGKIIKFSCVRKMLLVR